MKARDVLVKAIRRAKKKGGLRISNPNDLLSQGHVKKSDHNLIVMTDLNKMGHEDWVVITAYYAMYQSALALLAKIGLDSKEHAATVAVLEYFFGERIGRELIHKFNELKKRKDKIESIIIEDKYIDYIWKTKGARERVQYGISISYKETEIIMRNARSFTSKIKIVMNELDNKILNLINDNIQELKKFAEK